MSAYPQSPYSKRLKRHYIIRCTLMLCVSGLLSALGYAGIQAPVDLPVQVAKEKLDQRCLETATQHGGVAWQGAPDIHVTLSTTSLSSKEALLTSSLIAQACPSRTISAFCFGAECETPNLTMRLSPRNGGQ